MSDYAQTQSEKSRGKISKKSRQEISKEILEKIDMEKYRKAEDERKKERAILNQDEKGCTGQLLELGKLCYFVKAFDMINLEEQNIPQIGPFENPTETESFKKGFEAGEMLVRKGFTEESYHNFLETYENKYQQKNNKSK